MDRAHDLLHKLTQWNSNASDLFSKASDFICSHGEYEHISWFPTILMDTNEY